MTADALDSLETIEYLADLHNTDGIVDVLLQGWEDDYYAGRRLLLERLRYYRAQVPDKAATIAPIVYRTLIRFGEDVADMRWVHLGVESRDALLYGL
jgi:aminoglycoside phosphotransferase (APT) family kinase protein